MGLTSPAYGSYLRVSHEVSWSASMTTTPHKIYGAEFIEPQALAQFHDILKEDEVVQGALMPDAHLGDTHLRPLINIKAKGRPRR